MRMFSLGILDTHTLQYLGMAVFFRLLQLLWEAILTQPELQLTMVGGMHAYNLCYFVITKYVGVMMNGTTLPTKYV